MAEGYAKASGRVGRRDGDLGPRRHQPRHRDRRRDHGLGPDRVHHRPGPHRPDRHRRLPGGRRQRHHAADRQALDDGQGPAPHPRVHPRRPSTSPRPAAPARCWSTSRRTSRAPTSSTSPRTEPVELPGYKPSTEGNIKQIRIAAKALANSQRPVIYSGGGVINANASEELREFCLSDNFPVTSTLMGLGGFPAPARPVAGDAGHARHPHRQLRDGRGRPDRRRRRPLRRPHHRQAGRVRAARQVRPHRHRSGRDLQERPGPHPDRRRRQAGAAEADQGVPGDQGRLHADRPLVGPDPRLAEGVPARPRALRDGRDQAPGDGRGDVPRRPSGDAIITSDVGQHQMWAAQYYNFAKPRRWINSGGLGTMGFGLPAAIGAKVAMPRASRSSAWPATAA